jgi:hypothetical protein
MLRQLKKVRASPSGPFSPPPFLTGVEAEATAFPPLPSELRPLMHRVIDWNAPHPPLSVALSQVHSEAITAHRSTPPPTKLYRATICLCHDGESPTTPPCPMGSPRPIGPLPSATPLWSLRQANAGSATVLAPGAVTAQEPACTASLARLSWTGIAAGLGHVLKP